MSTQINFINLFFFLIINLVIMTINKSKLTYKGLQFLSIVLNFIILYYCLANWENYILKDDVENTVLNINTNSWLSISYELNFKVEFLSFSFILLIVVISCSTNIYILGYFKYEERQSDFILLINWFVVSMILLVISNNMVSILVGWELIGFTSFLLINFWKTKTSTLNSSFKAFTFNKVSDILLIISFSILWSIFKTDNISVIILITNSNFFIYSIKLKIAVLCLIISAGIKSAQIFLNLWLPDSMEAPVPASALIHSATLVSAGVYLLLKFHSLIILTNLNYFILIWGSLTACIGGLSAASQTDLKKILAYSTISHCGFLFICTTYNNIHLVLIYLYMHGIFKAATFFCVGSLIKINNTQDTRLMGLSVKSSYLLTILMITCSINLGGLPLTFGYLYKNFFMYNMIINSNNIFTIGLQFIGLLSSIVYVYKLIYYSLFDYRKGALDTVILLLQNNKNKNKNYFSHIGLHKIFATSIMLFFSFFFYIIFKHYILAYNINLNFLDLNNVHYKVDQELINKHYGVYYNIFYMFYLIIIFFLYFINWRYDITIELKISIATQIIIFLFSLHIYMFLISFILINMLFWQNVFLLIILMTFYSFFMLNLSILNILLNGEFVIIVIYSLLIQCSLLVNINYIVGISIIYIILGSLEISLAFLLLIIYVIKKNKKNKKNKNI